MALLTFQQQQAIKKISANNSGKYVQLAEEVEQLELTKLIGIAMLQDLQNNPATTDNANLLDGSEFEDCDGNTITHKGLRYVLAYMNYSKYLGESFVNDTFTGFVQKTRPDAEILQEGQIKRLQSEAREIAMTAWEVVKDFLNEKYLLYPYWNCTKVKKVYTSKFHGIKKTDY